MRWRTPASSFSITQHLKRSKGLFIKMHIHLFKCVFAFPVETTGDSHSAANQDTEQPSVPVNMGNYIYHSSSNTPDCSYTSMSFINNNWVLAVIQTSSSIQWKPFKPAASRFGFLNVYKVHSFNFISIWISLRHFSFL